MSKLDTPMDVATSPRLAGWTVGGPDLAPKIAAMRAGGGIVSEPPPRMTLGSKGRCLIHGGAPALAVAAELGSALTTTVCLAGSDDLAPVAGAARILRAASMAIRGHFGAFVVELRDAAEAFRAPQGDHHEFGAAAPRIVLEADIVLDLSGGRSLLAGCGERDGYIRANPHDPIALAEVIATTSRLVGEFEKPLAIAYDGALCAHARSGRTGCTNCLGHCPTGAIRPRGDRIMVDHGPCEGCGLCAATCPTGAIRYVDGRDHEILHRARAMISAFTEAGGRDAVLLAHEAEHGEPIFEAMAEFEGGLPARVIPLALASVLQAGHDLLLGLLLSGVGEIVLLVPPRHRDALATMARQHELSGLVLDALGYGARVTVLADDDPEQIGANLRDLPRRTAMPRVAFGTLGSKREIARSILAELHRHAPAAPDILALPAGSPYGSVKLDVERCTLCLACAGACPTGALRDAAERPELRFAESACVQCGICVATCPETALSLEPRLSFLAPAGVRSLNSDEPFRCRACDKPFGTRASIERVKRRLAGNPHFADARSLELVEMCADCRVVHMLKGRREPMAAGPRPRVTTSEDYVTLAGSPQTEPEA